ncbi:hypothetical protein [Paenibacillus sp. EKM212P]|nr:hypothetical protein [Paenibacillus sp. EKM212P]
MMMEVQSLNSVNQAEATGVIINIGNPVEHTILGYRSTHQRN